MSSRTSSVHKSDMGNAFKVIGESGSFLLIAHHSPDIDSIASAISLAIALKRHGKTAAITAEGTANGQISYFMKRFGFSLSKPDFSADCIIVVDTNSPSLFDLESVKKSKAKKILIDHHSPKEDVMAEFDVSIVDETAVSTTEIIYDLFKEWGEPITKEIAIALSAGIVTDSANFIAATPRSFHVLADSLGKSGASFQDVLSSIHSPPEQSEKIARLKGAQRLELIREGKYLIATSKVSSFEGSVARALLSLGADVSFVGAAKNGEVRISARAKNELTRKGLHLGRDILPSISQLIGGDAGGHAAAAGANGINHNSLDAALSICVSKTREFIKTI